MQGRGLLCSQKVTTFLHSTVRAVGWMVQCCQRCRRHRGAAVRGPSAHTRARVRRIRASDSCSGKSPSDCCRCHSILVVALHCSFKPDRSFVLRPSVGSFFSFLNGKKFPHGVTPQHISSDRREPTLSRETRDIILREKLYRRRPRCRGRRSYRSRL